MPLDLTQFEIRATEAVQHFWSSRLKATERQNLSGKADHGSRGAVTAGKNMDGFVDLFHAIATTNGMPGAGIIRKGRLVTLPGFFRPTKRWDLLLVHKGMLIAAIEMKSQVGSFGNNFNNRAEEAIGTTHDLCVAYREGAFGDFPKPFVGWLMLLENCPESKSPVNDRSPHFPIFKEFEGASYADRYEILCKKLVREQLCSAACLLLSPAIAGINGEWSGLSEITNLKTFVSGLAAHIANASTRF